jgi:hypothetical protein
MLRRLFCLLYLFLFSGVCFAQADSLLHSHRFEVSVGTGAYSSDRLFDNFTNGVYENYSYSYKKYSGAYFVTMKYVLTKRLSIGLSFAYENESGDIIENDPYGKHSFNSYTIGSYKRQAFTLSPELYFTYHSFANSRIYCYVGAGATLRNEIDTYDSTYFFSYYYNNGRNNLGHDLQFANNKVHFNWQFTPFGFQVGKDAFWWYIEVGIGYKGIVSSGLLIYLD